MKSRKIWKWSLGVCLTVLPFAGGCLRGASNETADRGGSELPVAQVATPANADQAALEAAKTNAPAVDISDAEIRPIEEEKPLPQSVRTTGPTGDLLKLAGSGVDESVILAYVTNSPSIFSLSADEIIYLKDLGLSSDVLAATLQRDHVLKASGALSAEEALAPIEPQGAGPTTNWIGAVPQQPDPSQVAPQATTPAIPEGQEQAVAAAAAPQTQVTYSTFYDSLAPYGTWLEVDGYGRVWQPTVVVVNSNWSPYFDNGRWVYTDHGWYWSSDYSWGWAPFHYGRWFRHHRIGWCWMPDLVWGPSWVTWRYNDAYCGWAPLPPAACYSPGFGFTYYGTSVGFGFSFGLSYSSYCYVNWNHFHHHHKNHLHAVPHHRAHDIHNQTRPVTKIVSERNNIINEGVSAQRVAAATRTEVRALRIRETSRSPETVRTGRAERIDTTGKTLTVYKPEASTGQRIGGLPMERSRTGFATTTAAASTTPLAVNNSGTHDRSTTTMQTRPMTDMPSRVETRISNSGVTASGQPSTPAKVESTRNEREIVSGQNSGPETRTTRMAPRNPEMPPAAVASNPAGNANAGPQTQAVSPKPDENKPMRSVQSTRPSRIAPTASNAGQPVPGNAVRPVQPPRPETQTAVTPSKAADQPSQARQPSAWASPRTAQTPSRIESQPAQPSTATQQAPPSLPRQPSMWASPRASQTPARTERQATATPASPQTPNVWASPRASQEPVASTPPAVQQRQYTAPSAPSVQRPYTPAPAPTRQQPYAPPQMSAPQRQFSDNPPRQYTAPPVQVPTARQFSPPTRESAPAPTPQRQYTAPPSAPPAARSQPSPNYSNPQRAYSPPSQSQRSFARNETQANSGQPK